MMKKRNAISLFIIIISFLALSLWLYTLVMKTGTDLRSSSIYLEYGFYALSILLAIFLLVRPFFAVLIAPSYNLQVNGSHDKSAVKLSRRLKKLASRLMKRHLIKEESLNMIKEEMRKKYQSLEEKNQALQIMLKKVMDDDMKKEIRKMIIHTARDTLYLTSLSQNKVIDVLVVLVNNFRLTKRIVKRCGFRPSYFQLLKFYINVALSSLIADGAQSMDISSLLGSSIKGLTKPVLGSLLDGTVNAFFMMRSGFLVRNYIFENHDTEAKEINLIKTAMADAAAAMPELTISTVMQPIIDILMGTFVTPTKDIIKKLFNDDTPYHHEELGNEER